MAQCILCNDTSDLIPEVLGLCLNCIRTDPDKAWAIAEKAHSKTRVPFGLPGTPPDDPDGIPCNICVNQCRIGERSSGYCGLRQNVNGRLTGNNSLTGKLSWYHDPLPTNCVADRVCPGGAEAGFPRYSHSKGPEFGYQNLAVFFHACTFDCLYCQNWHFKQQRPDDRDIGINELVNDITSRTSCICYFGGDPAPQARFALKASEKAAQHTPDRILRICWETNGSAAPELLDRMVDQSLASGGCIKFDLKAWDDTLHKVLTGVTNTQTLENFRRAGRNIRQRPDPPLLIAATLLVPGFIDEQEVSNIARFIASVDRSIPYNLLGFHPEFQMSDLPMTSKKEADRCLEAAKNAGLTRVRIGNKHLLE